MKPKFIIYTNDTEFVPEISKFPGGEIKVTVRPCGETVLILATLLNSDDIMTLVMLADAVRNAGAVKLRLTMPYVPYARQDRQCNAGEAFSLRAFAGIINSLNFASMVVCDVHSEVALKYIDRVINNPAARLLQDALTHQIPYGTVLLAPDKGAITRVQEIQNAFPNSFHHEIQYASKVRDPLTGKIIKTEVPNVFKDKHVLICDDICDGGRTFIEIAKIIKQQGPFSISLYVTHGIFSQGMGVLYEYFDNVSCYLDFNGYKLD